MEEAVYRQSFIKRLALASEDPRSLTRSQVAGTTARMMMDDAAAAPAAAADGKDSHPLP